MWWNIVFRVGYSCSQTKWFEKLCFCETYQVRAYVFADAHLVTYENRVGKMLKRTSPGKRFSVWQTGSILRPLSRLRSARAHFPDSGLL